jgi:hypothetical protein
MKGEFSVFRVLGVLGSKGWILPISRMGVNEWRVKPEANLEERRGPRMKHGRNTDLERKE